jgi:hypothetical protein
MWYIEKVNAYVKNSKNNLNILNISFVSKFYGYPLRKLASIPCPFWKVVPLLERTLVLSTMKSAIFWNVIPCSSKEFNLCFGPTYCLHFQDQKYAEQRARKRQPTSLNRLISNFFCHEDREQNVSPKRAQLLPDNTASYLRVLYSSFMH